jgi:hypothetical protein
MNFFQPKRAPNPEQTLQIQAWVRQALDLEENVTVMVSELRCSEPGCLPLETVVAILDGPGRRRQSKFHKPIAEISLEDIASAIWKT